MTAAPTGRNSPENGWGLRGLIALLLLATFLVRAHHLGQPIVENYVGRQIPTAMVARNLDRGKGLLWPQLDTAPFPNYFLVEPPVYEAGVVALKRATGLSLEEAGRILSALATALAAWGLFELARRREGAVVALLAVGAFAVFPLTIRYGRAFQPDAAMLGSAVAGIACWDRYLVRRRWYWLAMGWMLLALGFALKITAAFLLIPILLVIVRDRSAKSPCGIPGRLPARRVWRAVWQRGSDGASPSQALRNWWADWQCSSDGASPSPDRETPFRQILVACSTLLPAALWYAWASHLLGTEEGSRAPADNQSIWLGLIGPSALLHWETLKVVGWSLLVRAFTPLGAGLALIGILGSRAARGGRDALWLVWGLSALVTLAFLAGKLHHEYYWLVLAPVAAVGIGRTLCWLMQRSRACAVTLAAAFLVLAWAGSRSTWRTPVEWKGLEQAGRAVAAAVPGEAWVVAPEALLFQAERRGCRMEWSDAAAARAAGEWGASPRVEGPLDLIECYRGQGARYFADLRNSATDPRRKGLHDSVRRRYKVIVDRPDVIIADLAKSEAHWHGN
jgi:hypothetical protein